LLGDASIIEMLQFEEKNFRNIQKIMIYKSLSFQNSSKKKQMEHTNNIISKEI